MVVMEGPLFGTDQLRERIRNVVVGKEMRATRGTSCFPVGCNLVGGELTMRCMRPVVIHPVQKNIGRTTLLLSYCNKI